MKPLSGVTNNALPSRSNDTTATPPKGDSPAKTRKWESPIPSRLADLNFDKATDIGRDRAPRSRSTIHDLVRQSAMVGVSALPGGQKPEESALAPQVAGLRRRPLDLPMSRMAVESYSDKPAASDTYAKELAAQGWQRMEPHGDHLESADHTQLPINPSLLKDDKSGFEAGIWHRANPAKPGQINHLIIGDAGTNPKQMGDVKTDLFQGIGLDEKQYDQGTDLLQQAAAIAGKDNVAVAGHSLGGGLAANSALAVGTTAVTFNAAGVSDESLHRTGFKHVNDARAEIASNGQIRSHATAGDPLTTLDNHGAPPQMGVAWQVPAEGPGGNRFNPANVLALHSGHGEQKFFVDNLNSPHVKPGMTENPYVNPVVTALAGSTVAGIPFALSTPAARGAALNLTGAAISATQDFVADRHKPDASVVGSALNRAGDFVGAAAQIVGNAIGTDIRNAAEKLGVSPDTAARIAHVPEHSGDAIRARLEADDSSKAPNRS